jgi:hypothetical protein
MEPKKRREDYLNLDTAPSIYVNSVQIAQTAFDLRLVVGLLTAADDEKIVTKVEAVVFMSHQHAKVMYELLKKHIERYESLHGPLSIELKPEELALQDAQA